MHGLGLAVLDHRRGRAIGRLVDEDAVDGRGRLQARRGVDDVAGRHPLAFIRAGGERDHRLAGGDADADVEAERRIRRVEVGERVSCRQRAPHGALGVVLVRQRRAEERHDGVADELLDRAAEPLQLGLHPAVIGREHAADVLRIEVLGAAGEADEVGEEDADDLALLEDRRLDLAGRHDRAALRAEGELQRDDLPAGGAGPAELLAAAPAKERSRPVLEAAGGALGHLVSLQGMALRFRRAKSKPGKDAGSARTGWYGRD